MMIDNKEDKVMEEIIQSLLSRYQIELETSIKGSGLIFDCVPSLHYKFDETNFKRGGSYTDYPDWIKNKTATANPINKKDNKCFQNAAIVALNHEEIKKDLQRLSQIKPFTNKYNWEE